MFSVFELPKNTKTIDFEETLHYLILLY